jgi:hypothetical protein
MHDDANVACSEKEEAEVETSNDDDRQCHIQVNQFFPFI